MMSINLLKRMESSVHSFLRTVKRVYQYLHDTDKIISRFMQNGTVNQVNQTIVETNWNIGRYIVEYEQAGHEKAEYGSETLKRLSHDLSERYGRGFGMSNVNKMRKLYLTFPILQTLSAKLSWSHYVELLKIDDPQEIQNQLALLWVLMRIN